MNFLLQVEEEVQSQADCPRWGAGGTRWLKAGLSRHGVLAEKQRGAVLTWAQALVLWGRRCTSLTNPLPHLTQHRVNKHDTNFWIPGITILLGKKTHSLTQYAYVKQENRDVGSGGAGWRLRWAQASRWRRAGSGPQPQGLTCLGSMARPRHVPVPARSQQRDPPQLDLSQGRPWASQTQGAPLESTQAPGAGSRELLAGSRAGKWLRFNFTFVSSNGPPSLESLAEGRGLCKGAQESLVSFRVQV